MGTLTRSHSATILPMGLTMPDVLEEFDVAYSIIRNDDLATKAVARAVDQLAVSSAAQVDNRRPRLKRESPDGEGRLSYRPLTGPKELLRFWVLDELDEFELDLERSQRQDLKDGHPERCHLLTNSAQLRCFNKQVVKKVLNHHSFYAAVAVTQILANYTAQETLNIHSFVSPRRAKHKTWSDVSKAKRQFEAAEQRRFGTRIELQQDGASWKINSRSPEPAEIAQVITDLTAMTPSPLPVLPSISEKLFGMFSRSANEMGQIRKFFDIRQFDEVAGEVLRFRGRPSPAPWFRTHASAPIIADCIPDPDPDPKAGQKGNFDMDYFNDILEKERGRRPRKAPGSVGVRVDGIERSELNSSTFPCTLILEEGASVIKLVAEGNDGEPVTIAAHVLTYDGAKTEFWDVDLGELGPITIRMDYGDDEVVRVDFATPSRNKEEKAVASSSIEIGIGGTGPEMLPVIRGRLSAWPLAKYQLLDVHGHYPDGRDISDPAQSGDRIVADPPSDGPHLRLSDVCRLLGLSVRSAWALWALRRNRRVKFDDSGHECGESRYRDERVNENWTQSEAPTLRVLDGQHRTQCWEVMIDVSRSMSSRVRDVFRCGWTRRRRKEIAEDYWPTYAGPALSEHTASGGSLGAGNTKGSLWTEIAKVLVSLELIRLNRISRNRNNPGSALDALTEIQATAFRDFATQTREWDIPFEPAPRIVYRHQTVSAMFCAFAVVATLLDIFAGVRLLRDFDFSLVGTVVTAVIFASSLAAVSLFAKGAWKFSWSLRAFSRYHASRQAIERLRCVDTLGSIQDWRGLLLVQRLVWILETAGRRAIEPDCRSANCLSGAAALANLIQDDLGERRAHIVAKAVVDSRPIFSTSHLMKIVAETLGLQPTVVHGLVRSAPGQRMRHK